MAGLSFSFKHSLLSAQQQKSAGKKLQKEIKRMRVALQQKYVTQYASLYLPQDKQYAKNIKKVAAKYRSVDYIIVVGIGGSNLGTLAIADALGKRKISFCDTVDADLVDDVKKCMVGALKQKKKVLLNIVTKSGTTTETIANAQVLLETLKRYRKDWHKHVVVTTDFGSKLWHLAKKHDIKILEIPKLVGGRYSVFSAVGLFPFAVLGMNIDKMLAGAKAMRDQCLRTTVSKNPAALSAVHLYLHQKKRNIYDTFVFSTCLENVGKWYRQLMGESIGKEWNAKHTKKVYAGITPTVSVGSNDLHSLAQLYLGGPQDKYTTFISVKKVKQDSKIPKFKDFSVLVKNIQGKKLTKIMDAILTGVKTAYRKGKRPFSEIILSDKSERSLGQLLQMKMMEMMYLGYLLGVNPFDQPNVEAYKKETRRLLK